MRTLDLVKLGIDRNFLRKCERQGIINPLRVDNEWIINKEYIPKEYSREDIIKVWDTMLYRKMGLSYSQIKEFTRTRYEDIKKIDDYIKENTNEKLS